MTSLISASRASIARTRIFRRCARSWIACSPAPAKRRPRDTTTGPSAPATAHTPLVRLNRITRDVRPLVLVKCEQLNPGGSVKDRIGLRLIEACEAAGSLQPGGTIVEPTSGNTGTGLAIAAAIKGYRCVFVMSDKVSEEKRSLLRAYGAEVVICPSTVSFESPENYHNVAARLATQLPRE